MKNRKIDQQQAATGLQPEEFTMTEVHSNIVRPEPILYRIIEKSDDQAFTAVRRIQQLEEENSRLKCLLEDFAIDKLAQAQRIKELEHEKSLIKQTMAELILEKQFERKEF